MKELQLYKGSEKLNIKSKTCPQTKNWNSVPEQNIQDFSYNLHSILNWLKGRSFDKWCYPRTDFSEKNTFPSQPPLSWNSNMTSRFLTRTRTLYHFLTLGTLTGSMQTYFQYAIIEKLTSWNLVETLSFRSFIWRAKFCSKCLKTFTQSTIRIPKMLYKSQSKIPYQKFYLSNFCLRSDGKIL